MRTLKETGLMFKAPLVRAILAGQKTQTRRLVDPAPAPDQYLTTIVTTSGRPYAFYHERIDSPNLRRIRWESPVGQPGDRIYVRETHWAWGRWETRYSEFKGCDEWHFVDMTTECGREYQFTDPLPDTLRRCQGGVEPTWWNRPGIHMPKSAARIWLEVTGVRVERLQDISNEDAIAEGVNLISHGRDGSYYSAIRNEQHPKNWIYPDDAFRELWESTSGDWAANPWVWVVDFKVLSTTGKPIQSDG